MCSMSNDLSITSRGLSLFQQDGDNENGQLQASLQDATNQLVKSQWLHPSVMTLQAGGNHASLRHLGQGFLFRLRNYAFIRVEHFRFNTNNVFHSSGVNFLCLLQAFCSIFLCVLKQKIDQTRLHLNISAFRSDGSPQPNDRDVEITFDFLVRLK